MTKNSVHGDHTRWFTDNRMNFGFDLYQYSKCHFDLSVVFNDEVKEPAPSQELLTLASSSFVDLL